jgi:hypothetical protein
MSSEIIYHQIAVRIPAEHAGSSEDLFVHMAQMGSSNCYECAPNGSNGRRSRSWQPMAFGTAKDVLTWGIKCSGDMEGGMVKMGSASAYGPPEKYIRKVRSLLANAAKTDVRRDLFYKDEWVSLSISYRETDEGRASKKTPYDIRDPESFKAFWTRYQAEGQGKQAWCFFEVRGPELR